mgnify:FL=1
MVPFEAWVVPLEAWVIPFEAWVVQLKAWEAWVGVYAAINSTLRIWSFMCYVIYHAENLRIS